jgi:ribosomal protein L4
MELKVINEQGQEAAKLQASDVLFGREFNEALVHQIVVAYQANARSGDASRRIAPKSVTPPPPWRQKGTVSCWLERQPAVAWGRSDFPELSGPKLFPEG